MKLLENILNMLNSKNLEDNELAIISIDSSDVFKEFNKIEAEHLIEKLMHFALYNNPKYNRWVEKINIFTNTTYRSAEPLGMGALYAKQGKWKKDGRYYKMSEHKLLKHLSRKIVNIIREKG